jgi:hypothetical protein
MVEHVVGKMDGRVQDVRDETQTGNCMGRRCMQLERELECAVIRKARLGSNPEGSDEGEKGRGEDAKVDDCRALRLVAGHSTNSNGEVELAEREQ